MIVTNTAQTLISRLLLALFLAAVAVLIPGGATRVLAAPPLSWSAGFERGSVLLPSNSHQRPPVARAVAIGGARS